MKEGEKKPAIQVNESSLSYWNRTSFYSTLGIYYDSLPSFPTVSQPRSLFEEGSHFSSLISSLSSEEEWEESVYSFSDDWYPSLPMCSFPRVSRFQKLLDEVHTNYKSLYDYFPSIFSCVGIEANTIM